MPLERVRRPTKNMLVPLPGKGDRPPSPLPKLQPFADERAFWYVACCDEDNSPGRRHAALNIMTGLDEAFRKGEDAHYLMSRNPDDITKELTRIWYVFGVTLLAYAGLRRAMWDSGATIHDMDGVPRDVADLKIYGDFHPNEPFSCGLHAQREELTQELDIPWPARPNEGIWLDGDTFYAKVFRPATPTKLFTAWHQTEYGQPFEAQAWASVVPILKAEVVFA